MNMNNNGMSKKAMRNLAIALGVLLLAEVVVIGMKANCGAGAAAAATVAAEKKAANEVPPPAAP